MQSRVTIAIPVYKRLDYLPLALQAVQAQDYGQIDLIVSDNGMNGNAVPGVVEQYYTRPSRFRQNAQTVNSIEHFNQLIQEAAGEYFILLCDDDDISPNFVSEMVRTIESHPSASVVISKQDAMDEKGRSFMSSSDLVPEYQSGLQFIRSWAGKEYNFQCFVTNLARTQTLKECGGYPDFSRGQHSDDGLLVKLLVRGDVAFNPNCVFRWRIHEASLGWSDSIQSLALATRQFLEFLETDPHLSAYKQTNPAAWKQSYQYLVRMAWDTYYSRWATMYKAKLSKRNWVKSAFALPFIPGYYRTVIPYVLADLKYASMAEVGRRFPLARRIYRAVRYR